jgi:hypothetical protein
MISIGAVFRGPELNESEIRSLILATTKATKEIRGPLQKGERPWVNAVFIVAGSLGKPDFDKLTYGEYSKKSKGLVVQIPILAEVVRREALVEFLMDSLHGANAMAFEFFRQQGEMFPLRDAEELVNRIAEQLQVL